MLVNLWQNLLGIVELIHTAEMLNCKNTFVGDVHRYRHIKIIAIIEIMSESKSIVRV